MGGRCTKEFQGSDYRREGSYGDLSGLTPPASAGGLSISKLQSEPTSQGHHRALAGGLSISKLQSEPTSQGHHRALAGGLSISKLQRGPTGRYQVPPAKAWWCPGVRKVNPIAHVA